MVAPNQKLEEKLERENDTRRWHCVQWQAGSGPKRTKLSAGSRSCSCSFHVGAQDGARARARAGCSERLMARLQLGAVAAWRTRGATSRGGGRNSRRAGPEGVSCFIQKRVLHSGTGRYMRPQQHGNGNESRKRQADDLTTGPQSCPLHRSRQLLRRPCGGRAAQPCYPTFLRLAATVRYCESAAPRDPRQPVRAPAVAAGSPPERPRSPARKSPGRCSLLGLTRAAFNFVHTATTAYSDRLPDGPTAG